MVIDTIHTGFLSSRKNSTCLRIWVTRKTQVGLPPPCIIAHFIRRTWKRIHTVNLTDPTASATEALAGIVNGTLHAVESSDLKGNKIHIFLDFIRFLVDYHEEVDGLDVLNHSENPGFNAFSFRKDTTDVSNSYKNAYSSSIHARNTSSARSVWKHTALRRTGVSADYCNFIVMFPTSRLTNENLLSQ